MKVIKFEFIIAAIPECCSLIYFMSRSKCGSHLLMIIYNIQANHDAMGFLKFLTKKKLKTIDMFILKIAVCAS